MKYAIAIFTVFLMVGIASATVTSSHSTFTFDGVEYSIDIFTDDHFTLPIVALISDASNYNVFSASQAWEHSNVHEFQIVQDPSNSTITDMWYSGDGTTSCAPFRSVGHAVSTDANVHTWVKDAGNPLSLGKNIGEPYVFYDPGTSKYYLLGIDSWVNESTMPACSGNGYEYMWNSTDKVTWTIMNGGDPVFKPSSQPYATNNRFWNVAVKPVVVSGQTYLVMFYDGGFANQSLPTGYYNIGFTYTTLSELNFTAHVKPTFAFGQGMETPDFVYVPDRNAYLLFLLKMSPYGSTGAVNYVAFADATDPINPTNYKVNLASPLLPNRYPVIEADPTVVFPIDKNYNMTLMMTYNQGTSYSEYFSQYTLDDFYDSYYTGAVAQ